MRAQILCLALALVTSQCFALQNVTSFKNDIRIKKVNYDEHDVVPLKGHYGISTEIVFHKGEAIESAAIGDSMAWQSVPINNHLFIKPLAESITNMTVITNKRSYTFDLATSTNNSDMVYKLEFSYPKLEKAKTAANKQQPGPKSLKLANYNYKFDVKDIELAPISVFDDAEFTYIKFADNQAIPAIFVLDNKGKQSLINHAMNNDLVVVEGVYKELLLKSNNKKVRIMNVTKFRGAPKLKYAARTDEDLYSRTGGLKL